MPCPKCKKISILREDEGGMMRICIDLRDCGHQELVKDKPMELDFKSIAAGE